MSVGSDFADLLPNLVVVQNMISRDSHGQPVYDDPLPPVPGRFVRKPRIVKTATGQMILSSSFVTMPPVAGLTVESRVVVDGEDRPVVMVESAPDETGADYYCRVRFA